MKVLTIKDTNHKLFLAQAWASLDEDVFLKNIYDRVFKLIAVYFIEDDEGDSYFNIAKGEIDLDTIEEEAIKSAFEVYDWKYDLESREVITDDETFDKDWSDYLLAEVLLNHCDEGDLDIIKCDTFEEVVKNLDGIAITASQLANNYILLGKDWLIGEYGKYEGNTTGMDADEEANDKEIRLILQKEIEKDSSVSKVWWQKEHYGYTLWIKFA